MVVSLNRILKDRGRGLASATLILVIALALSLFPSVVRADSRTADGAASGDEPSIQSGTVSKPWVDAEIDQALATGKSAFLYFYADWCPYCQKQKPIVDELENKYAEAIAFIRVNGSGEPQALEEFGVTAFPAMFFIWGKDAGGEYIYQQYMGLTDEETLSDEFDTARTFNGGPDTAVPARAENICYYAGPDTSPDSLQLTDFTVVGQTPLRVGDTINVAFKLTNLAGQDVNLGQKSVFVAATDPNNNDASFGFTYPVRGIFAARQTLSIQVSRVLDKPGTWVVWPSYQLAPVARGAAKLGPYKWHACSLTVQTALVPPPVTPKPIVPSIVVPPPVTPPPVAPAPVVPAPVVPEVPKTVNVTLPGGLTKAFNLPTKDIVKEGPISMADGFQDSDKDGVPNFLDECPNTPAGKPVFDNGCRCQDSDGGMNYDVKGNIRIMPVAGLQKSETVAWDTCGTGGNVEERYCNPDYETGKSTDPVSNKTEYCGFGCSEGKCKKMGPCASAEGSCRDGIQNQGEAGVDCGGKCPPCNTKCTTGTRWAPPDTPCTTHHPADPHRVNYTWTDDSDFESVCRRVEVCHKDLDWIIEEALQCCGASSEEEVNKTVCPTLCTQTLKESGTSCQRCVGLYLIRGLGTSARWMREYQKPTGPWPETAEHLINHHKTGICRHYALALTTLLRKAGYSPYDVGMNCDGAHCYNVVRLPGDIKWHVVDTTGNNTGDINLGGLPNYSYPYCAALNEDNWCFRIKDPMGPGGSYYTGTIEDLDKYWSTAEKGLSYEYPFKSDHCSGPERIRKEHLPECGPGVACHRDNYRIPDWAPRLKQIAGCGGP